MDDFIRAAQTILESEGLEGISARKVAEKAGWSYATIYNYFKDINHLLWHCIPAYIADIHENIIASVGDEPDGLNQLLKAHKAYVQFFIERPKIYKLMFLSDFGPPPTELTRNLADPVLGRGQEEVLKLCARQGLIDNEDIQLIGELIVVAVNGVLYLQATGKVPFSSLDLDQKIDGYIRYIFKERR